MSGERDVTPYHADDWLTVYLGDCRAVLATLPADSVHCVVTSPPYYGLRDYGTASWEGGDEACDHRIGRVMGNANKGAVRDVLDGDRERCRCGAHRIDSQLGLEPTPEAYVEALVAVFREVRRVLRPDGTVWLNLGDSYASGGGERLYGSSDDQTGRGPGTRRHDVARSGLKPKDRMMIPARVALALQADGWWLRDEIVWAKPNPMPSSVTDRTTPAHEMVYLLTKRARYWYDADAVREAATYGGEQMGVCRGTKRRAVSMGRQPSGNEVPGADAVIPMARNKRSVWTIATQPYPAAHFATFPEALVEPMILAGCPEGGTVLDPFAGSGTVGLVAQRHSRRAILIDLSAEYMEQLIVRNRDIPLGLGA